MSYPIAPSDELPHLRINGYFECATFGILDAWNRAAEYALDNEGEVVSIRSETINCTMQYMDTTSIGANHA